MCKTASTVLTKFGPVAIAVQVAIMILGTSGLIAADPTVAYSDDFSTVKGYRAVNTNGALEEPDGTGTRVIFTFMSESILGGKLAITALEDNVTSGPDGNPGVLSLAYGKIPTGADYSGFVYQGRTENPIKLPNFKGDVGEEQLKQVTVSFRYKAVNADVAHVGADYNCRFEPDVDNPYEHRVDFGVLEATGEWKKFEQTLSRGSNKSEFLRAVNESPEAAFKLVWGQEGDITSYNDGDTLLIDDITISIAN